MENRTRSGLVGGFLLIALGVLLLVGQLVPGLWSWVGAFTWPLIVVAVGIFLLLLGVLLNAPGMAVPACIVGGIGLLLTWQNNTGNWESWAYAWTLIPGFVGVGIIVMGLWAGDRNALGAGGWLILISLILFAIFSSFLGGPSFLGNFWPLLLIGLGVLLLFQALRRRGPSQNEDEPHAGEPQPPTGE